MSDKWSHTHETAIRGPVSGDELLRLVRTGGVLPTDMVWPDGADSAKAVPAQAALQFLKAAPTDPGEIAAARPPAPAWLPDLASALARGDKPASLPSPPPESWLADLRRVEESSPPPGTEAAPIAARGPRWTVNALAMELAKRCDELRTRYPGLGWIDLRNALVIAPRSVEQRAAEEECGTGKGM
jgi:hypothetical protein